MENDPVFVGKKEIKHYIAAGLFALSKSEKVVIKSRGKNNKTALDVLAILKRDYVENPKYDVMVDSEEFKDDTGKINKVTTLEIELSGIRKEKE